MPGIITVIVSVFSLLIFSAMAGGGDNPKPLSPGDKLGIAVICVLIGLAWEWATLGIISFLQGN